MKMDIAQLYSIYKQYPQVQTDTRALKKGDLFFALKGPNFNANTFAKKALENGAAYAIVDEEIDPHDDRIIVVDNVLNTLQQLAKYHREQFKIPFIGITGSNGKTTTKELVHAVLSQQYTTYFTQGNLNNHIGIPLTLLRVKQDAEIAIIEMGASHQKEIEGYCKYAEPSIGIITNCGKAHLEGFGGVEGVRKGKGELYDYIRANDGQIFAFSDYDYLHSMSHDIEHIYWYGTKDGAITGKVSNSDNFLQVEITKGLSPNTIIKTQLIGDYNLPNVLCAVAIGKAFDVPEKLIIKGIENYAPSNSRSQLIEKQDKAIILDAYNANPSSMKAAIENFEKFEKYPKNKVLLLGAMKELGEESREEHQSIIDLIKQYQWKAAVVIGKEFESTNHDGILYFDDVSQAKIWAEQQDFKQTSLLIKGSNSVHMSELLEAL